MSKEKKVVKKAKKRAEKYDPKLKFDGSFKDMIDASIKDAEKKKKPEKK